MIARRRYSLGWHRTGLGGRRPFGRRTPFHQSALQATRRAADLAVSLAALVLLGFLGGATLLAMAGILGVL